MILVRSPLRVSLAGGGSDLKSFYSSSFGQVISFAIKKYVYVASHSLFSGGLRFHYSQTENVESVNDIVHPLIRNSLKLINFSGSLEMGSFADVPGSGTGLGSSSAFTAATLLAAQRMMNLDVDKPKLAQQACQVELEMCGEPIGKQDQYSTVFGGINCFKFNHDETVEVKPMELSNSQRRFLQKTLFLLYLGFGRKASDILIEQQDNLENEAKYLRNTQELRDMVPGVVDAVQKEEATLLGSILEDSWKIKKSLASGISNTSIDEIYDLTKKCGVFGGKVVGAGGGGFMLLASGLDSRARVIERFGHSRIVELELDDTGTVEVFSSEKKA